MKFSVKTIVFTAVFAALCCVATMVIIVPLPNGYVNLGDVFVLLSGWCLGPCFGPIAAGIGSMIADIVSGYAMYAPVTFAVKALVSLCAYFVWYLFRSIIKNNKLDFLSRLISAIVGEIVMVFGYFLYESILYGFAGGALALLGNTLQGVCCAVVGVLIVIAIINIKYFNKIFPHLCKNEE